MNKTSRTPFLMEFIVKLREKLNIYIFKYIYVHMIYSYKFCYMLKMTRESAMTEGKETETGLDGGLRSVSFNF